MEQEKYYVGDTGTVIRLDVKVDISSATVRKIKAEKPDGTEVVWDAVAIGSNLIAYTTLAGTLDQAGEWKLQADVTTPAGRWDGATAKIMVYAAFD